MHTPRALPRLLSATILSASLLLIGASSISADAPPGPYFNGFETNTSGWFDSSNGWVGTITRQPSTYNNGGYASGIGSASGGWHARVSADACVVPAPCTGPNTHWGGYNQEFPIGGYRTYVAIYLDTVWAGSNPDARFDWVSAINNSATGMFLRDFAFNAGTNRLTDLGPAGFFINASTNSTRSGAFPQNTCPAPSAPPNACRLPVHITTSGWYTFRHTFRADGGFLAVDFDIFNSSGSVAGWTIHTGDCFAPCVPGPGFGFVGGNRYGWFSNEEIPELAIDDSARSGLNLSLTPATANNQVGTNHTVTATATTTDPNGHPSPGPGVTVEFDVIAGPNTGQTSHPNSGTCSPSDCTTAVNGQVSWTYTSNGTAGTDTIRACFPERAAVVQRPGDDPRTCATATKSWGSSTGKVTGGGQIQGDPVFALDGALLSVPALVPSLAGSGSQASFGFTVQSNGSAKGNLEYNDKPAGVRIKAISIPSLFITSGTCGANSHAEFSGTAEVTRPSGTSTEGFTVKVDDCGEPGTADTFGITTTGGYANGPSTLIGGNIQIHR
jgi:hypothetical protein